ncbi:vacuolar protein 14 C-terminal Fig4p binding-domain-containing protein [Hyaloraphidium curvatum]|nr:vacuolar protein 14 C-terminal Fig4p binding-domain-containing protein [Hyaloraphidium curvatum]
MQAAEPPPFSFPPAVARGLADKLYDKRKVAALDVERLVRDALASSDREKPRAIIAALVKDYIYSLNASSRNGGLIGLAAASIALGSTIASHLSTILPPVITCLADQDSRVRYYACEAVYNIGKVARGGILVWFNELFDALCKLSSDPEASVRSGSELLDRLLKDIISEGSAPSPALLGDAGVSVTPPYLPRLPHFSLERFVPLLRERLYAVNPNARVFLVDWIHLLDSIPDLELIRYLPEFLDGLFGYLSDPNQEVRTRTGNALAELLDEIGEVESVQRERREGRGAPEDGRYVFGEGIELDYGKMMGIVAPFLVSGDEETQATALRWTDAFISLAGDAIVPFVPALVGAILPCLSHSSSRIKQTAVDTNAALFALVLRTAEPSDHIKAAPDPPTANSDLVTDGASGSSTALVPRTAIDYSATVSALTNQFANEHEETRVAAIDWLSMLQTRAPTRVQGAAGNALLALLSDVSEEVVRRDLALLAQIAGGADEAYFGRFVVSLLGMFAGDRRLLEARGALVVRILCASLDPERMFVTMAGILEGDPDMEFAGTMVQNLNVILMTAPEVSDLRKKLRNLVSGAPDAAALFSSLYRSWCHNAVSAFSLCLLAQAYDHAANVLQIIADLEVTVSLLIQVDKLVQLLESPVFTYLRLQLLEPERHPHLYKCLYGIMMLLPQSSAFVTLRNRLNSVGSMVLLNVARSPGQGSADPASIAGINWAELLRHFTEVQERHEKARKQARAAAASRRTRQKQIPRHEREASVDGLAQEPQTAASNGT